MSTNAESPVAAFKPFENDEQSMLVGPGEGMTIENHTDTIAVYGDVSVSLNKDQAQLASLDDLIAALTKIRSRLVSGHPE